MKSIYATGNAFLVAVSFIAGCATNIQQAYWNANTSVASQAEEKGDLRRAETEFLIALNRARSHLGSMEVSSSLFNLGHFYLRHGPVPTAIEYFSESLVVEEKVSGPESNRTARRLAGLADAYWRERNFKEGRPVAQRLSPLASTFSGSDRAYIDQLLEVYRDKPDEWARDLARLQPLAEKGDAKAQFELAKFYEEGRGVPQDYKRAVELFLLSANNGYLDSQYYAGVIYDKGRGVPPDDQEARKWYRVAAEGGHKIAQYNYGVFLGQGRGGPRNESAAIEWLRKSSAQGYVDANRALKVLQPE